MHEETQPVGVVGLGSMGMGTALSLINGGFEVWGYDIDPDARQRFAAAGGRSADSPAEAAQHCSRILVVVVNADQVDSVLFGDQGITGSLQAGGLVIQCATVAPSYARSLGNRLDDLGYGLLDAPISGGAAKARSGQLSVMASGARECFERAADLFEAIADKVYQLGDAPGKGSSVKLVNQLLAGVHIAAAAEAMALGLSMDLDPEVLYEVITHSAGNSWMFENRVPHIMAGDYTPLSAVDIFVKDLGLVHATGREQPLALPLASTALQQFTAASAAGHGREDDSAVIKVYEHLSGIKLPRAAAE